MSRLCAEVRRLLIWDTEETPGERYSPTEVDRSHTDRPWREGQVRVGVSQEGLTRESQFWWSYWLVHCSASNEILQDYQRRMEAKRCRGVHGLIWSSALWSQWSRFWSVVWKRQKCGQVRCKQVPYLEGLLPGKTIILKTDDLIISWRKETRNGA